MASCTGQHITRGYFSGIMRPGEVPIGTCVRVVPGMVWADRYCVSDLMRDDGRDRHNLVVHRAVSRF
jgi:hypothetical protein